MSNEIRKQLNGLIEKNDKIKAFFDSLREKQKLLDMEVHPEAIIAFYLGLLQIKDLNLAMALDVKLGSNLPQELALDLALIRALNIAIKLSKKSRACHQLRGSNEINQTSLPYQLYH